MNSFEKLAVYLDSFDPRDENYDYACYIREKLANLPAGQAAHEEENNNSQEMEIADLDKSKQDLEGSMMAPAFKDLDAMNQIDQEKSQIKTASTILQLLKNYRSS